MATLQEIKSLVAQGEHQRLEFKRKIDHPEKVIKEVVAFANSGGGTLLVGISDNGAISGLRHPEEDAYLLNDAINKYCNPPIKYQVQQIPISEKKAILNYRIAKSDSGPHYVNTTKSKEAFIRIEDKSVRASREIREIMRQKQKSDDIKLFFGPNEKLLMQHIDINKSLTVSQYMELTNLPRKSASKKLVLFVLAGVLSIIPQEREDLFVANESR